jgi:transglutaminase-like putative cysteine protease
MAADGRYGARAPYAESAPDNGQPFVELTSRIQTQNRAQDWSQKSWTAESAQSLARLTQATLLIAVDGIVRDTAKAAVGNTKSVVENAQKMFDWVVQNAYREPKVRGFGESDIAVMLESGNPGVKCVDLNALFVSLCRAVGLPARDVYGLRLAPSPFGYMATKS